MQMTPRARLAAFAACVAVCVAALGACSDQPAPVAPGGYNGLSLAKGGTKGRPTSSTTSFDTTNLVHVTSLMRNTPLESGYYGSALITPKDGGYFQIQPAGITVYAPPGAVTEPMTIWARALGGSSVAYEFGPHGTVFAQPVYILQDLRSTTWPLIYQVSRMAPAYFKDAVQVDTATGTAYVDELLPTLYSVNKNNAVWTVTHFSGYLLAIGRQ